MPSDDILRICACRRLCSAMLVASKMFFPASHVRANKEEEGKGEIAIHGTKARPT